MRFSGGFARAAEVAISIGLLVEARAQAPAPSPGGAEQGGGQLQQMTVTGYLIPRAGEGPQPVLNYDRDYIEKTGYQTVTDVLQSLPSAVGNFAPNVTTGFSFSPGSASVALKGLPPNNTLTLVDGLRYPQFPFPQVSTSAVISFVDLNSIPLASVDRIEVLNDGGSATYGTDAIAGVVNVIIKDEYNGADLLNYFGISQRGDAEVYHGSLVGGLTQKLSDTSKVSIVAAIDYYTSGPIMQEDRAFTTLQHSRFSPKYPDQPNFPPYAGQFSDAAGNFYQVIPGTKGPAITASDFTVNGPLLNEFNSQFYQLQPRESRLGGLVKFKYEPTEWLKFYDSLIIQRNEELSSYQNEGVYSPSAFNSGGVTVPANNPFNPFGVPLTIDSLALGEFGPFRTDTTITTLRNVAGVTIQLPCGWYIDSNVLYGESDGTETINNNFTVSGLQAALNGTLAGNVGQFFNPFTDQSVSGPNKAFYGNKLLVASLWEDNRTDIFQYHATAGGTLINLPTGALTVAGGFEYRSESFIQNEDTNSKIGNVTDFQFTVGKLTSGRRYIWSIFGEVDIPILGEKWSVPGMRLLDAVVSERQDYYSDFGSAAKPKFAIRYKPFNDLTFRATYSEGFAAPSLPELFGAPLPAETTITDPKLGSTYTVINSVKGNPGLKPENAYSYYVGAVWSPGSVDPDHSWWGWANGFSAYVDWFQIDKHNVIGTLQPQNIVDLGASAPAGNFTVRGPSGLITTVNGSYLNLGNWRNDGIEFGFTYTTKEFCWGKLDFDFSGDYLYNVSVKTVQGLSSTGTLFSRVFNETDTFQIGPDVKLLGSVFYSKRFFGIDTFRTGITMHYVGSEADTTNNFNGTNPTATLTAPGYVHQIGSWTTFDWQISYQFGKPEEVTPEAPKAGYDKEGKRLAGEAAISPKTGGSSWGIRSLIANTTLTFGINNVFDRRAAYSADWYQGYDSMETNAIQRYFYVSVEKKF
jgi:iron complex outermembrane recepter protein